jgi:hypothetical protein
MPLIKISMDYHLMYPKHKSEQIVIEFCAGCIQCTKNLNFVKIKKHKIVRSGLNHVTKIMG